MTTEELLALPDDGMDRWLINGELREKPMTVRSRFHSSIMVRIGAILLQWRDQQVEPRGKVYCGECGVRLKKSPDTTVGVDVLYAPPELVAVQSDSTTVVEGIPSLIVEILSPSDTVAEINEKVAGYRAAGVPHVWVVNPYVQTVSVHRPDCEPVLFNKNQEITAEPQLSGFKITVSRFFE
jgi:Uma2 family endonuclease